MLARTTHATLLARLSDAGDSAAWSEFCQRYGDLVRGFARRRGLGASDCDDVLQDVLAALVSSMPAFRYDPAKGRFRGYLKTIAVRAIWRRRCQNPAIRSLQGNGSADEDLASRVADEAADRAVDEQWEVEWRQFHVRTAMTSIEAEFGTGDRAAFQMYAVDGRGAKETADALGLSVDQVYQAKSRVLRRLGELVAEQVAEEG